MLCNRTAGGGGYGQNIGAGAPPNDVGAMLTNEMYGGEINLYPLPWGVASPDMTNFENWGHFSQIVWNNTVSVGCATVTCSTLGNTEPDVAPYFTVCNYYPAGMSDLPRCVPMTTRLTSLQATLLASTTTFKHHSVSLPLLSPTEEDNMGGGSKWSHRGSGRLPLPFLALAPSCTYFEPRSSAKDLCLLHLLVSHDSAIC